MLVLGNENAAARILLEKRDLSIATRDLDVERTLLEEMPDGSEQDRSALAMQAQYRIQRAIQEITELARLQISAHGESVRRAIAQAHLWSTGADVSGPIEGRDLCETLTRFPYDGLSLR